jgi:hypothetical protein
MKVVLLSEARRIAAIDIPQCVVRDTMAKIGRLTAVKQSLDHVQVTVDGRGMQRRLPAHVSAIRIGKASSQQQIHDVQVATLASDVKWRILLVVTSVDRCTILNALRQRLCIATVRGVVHRFETSCFPNAAVGGSTGATPC